jgi:hypothetical protein
MLSVLEKRVHNGIPDALSSRKDKKTKYKFCTLFPYYCDTKERYVICHFTSYDMRRSSEAVRQASKDLLTFSLASSNLEHRRHIQCKKMPAFFREENACILLVLASVDQRANAENECERMHVSL